MAVAGPDCPWDGRRTVHISGAPGAYGWRDARLATHIGDCGPGFLYSRLRYRATARVHPENYFQWRFTTGLGATHRCRIRVYVPNSPLASQRLWYSVAYGFDENANGLASFTLDQNARHGQWYSGPWVASATGRVRVEIGDNGRGNPTGGRSIAAAPVQLACR